MVSSTVSFILLLLLIAFIATSSVNAQFGWGHHGGWGGGGHHGGWGGGWLKVIAQTPAIGQTNFMGTQVVT
uniref:Uncharacterized protein n=1 Tax=Pristionchus pacificus TaxID=54126 RepID=A0A2A6C4C5_PRIPA|eukprot:PDM72989.1 hypothetical protein PRIPAC_39423 [Pristionchus pacificus]